MNTTTLIFLTIALLVGLGVGYYLRILVSLSKKTGVEIEIKKKLLEAKEEAQKIVDKSNEKAEERLKQLENEEKEKLDEIKKQEERINKREDFLSDKEKDLSVKEEALKKDKEVIERLKEEVEDINKKKQAELEKISGLSEEEAKEKLIKQVAENYEEDLMVRIQKLENTAEEKIEQKAKNILAATVQRLANSGVSDLMTSTVSIPSEEIKGKIIGKEGRNIRAFESASGTQLIIDDTPGTILISSFDPVRRQVARVALENLIIDGRIQPAKIEEEIKKAEDDINKIIKQKGEEAVYECGVFNLDPRVVAILGRLYFRTSYGQNVLQHSVEMAHLAGILAEEIGADVQIAKAGALVHDIGKALTHEVQGTHVDIGIRILTKFGTDQRIIDAMKSHHEEYPYETIESIIVQTADAISGGRPGARSDTAENYIKRLSETETLVKNFSGIEKAYVISAGREVRAFVNPENITDIEAKELSRDIAKKIEEDLKYPGEIKVIVIRENRIISYAR